MTQESIAALSDEQLEAALKKADREAGWARQDRRRYDTRRGFGAEQDAAEEARIAEELIETDSLLGALRAEREHRRWLAEPPRAE